MNDGKAFEVVEVGIVGGDVFLGVRREPVDPRRLEVWRGTDLLPSSYDWEEVEWVKSLPPVLAPPDAYEEVEQSTGGSGPLTRWTLPVACGEAGNPAKLMVAAFCDESLTAAEGIVERNPGMDFFPDPGRKTVVEKEGAFLFKVRVGDKRLVPFLVDALAERGASCVSADENEARDGDLVVDKVAIAPQRCISNWRQPFLPEGWEPSTFTFKEIEAQATRGVPEEEVVKKLDQIPPPLQSHALRRARQKLERRREQCLISACAVHSSLSSDPSDENKEKLKALLLQKKEVDRLLHLSSLPDSESGVPPLSKEQNLQILAATYRTIYAPKKEFQRASDLLLFRYLLNGWRCRLAGQYERSGKHVGHGKERRAFRARKEEYERCKDHVDVLNRTVGGTSAGYKYRRDRVVSRKRQEKVDYTRTTKRQDVIQILC